jgi:tRNA pseudouridine55 synthase
LASRRGRSLQGALLVDKPAGPTSHDVVAFVRRALDVDRAGHTGTLDPLATGLLIVLVGTATRLAQFLGTDEKEYVAAVRLGVATPTYDAASLDAVRGQASEVPSPRSEVRGPRSEVRGPRSEVGGPWSEVGGPWSDAEIAQALNRFRGTFMQTPPPFSAKKIASVPAYEKARKNQTVELSPVEVTVRELEVLTDRGSRTTDTGLLRLRVAASSGFYVRSLAHDIGQALGCGAHLEALRRTRAGRFRVEGALTLDRLESEAAGRLISPSDLLGHLPAVSVTEDGARRVNHGNPVAASQVENGYSPPVSQAQEAVPLFRVLDGTGRLVAVAEGRPGGVLQPIVVLR